MDNITDQYFEICRYYCQHPASTLGYAREEYEIHHIYPKELGGPDDPANLVELPFEVHQFVHLLLTEIYPENDLLEGAYWYIMGRGCNGGKNSPRYGKSHSEEAIDKMRGRKLSEETRAKMSDAKRGKKMSEEHRAKISAIKKGKYVGDKNPMRNPEVAKRHGEARRKPLSKEEIEVIQQFPDWLDVGPQGIWGRLKKQGITIGVSRIKRLQLEYSS